HRWLWKTVAEAWTNGVSLCTAWEVFCGNQTQLLSKLALTCTNADPHLWRKTTSEICITSRDAWSVVVSLSTKLMPGHRYPQKPQTCTQPLTPSPYACQGPNVPIALVAQTAPILYGTIRL